MPTGLVIRFDQSSGDARIRPDDGADVVLVRGTEVEGPIGIGDRVEFELADAEGRPIARSVRVLEASPVDIPRGRLMGAPPTWDELEEADRHNRQQRRRRR